MNNNIIIKIKKLYLNYTNKLRVVLYNHVSYRELASEFAQEAFFRIIHYPNIPIKNTRTWLYRKAGNFAADHYRVYTKYPLSAYIDDLEVHDQLVSDLADPARVIAARQILTRICTVIDELPPHCHRTFVLHKFDGHTHEEIAAMLDITCHTVEKLLIQALVKLRNILD